MKKSRSLRETKKIKGEREREREREKAAPEVFSMFGVGGLCFEVLGFSVSGSCVCVFGVVFCFCSVSVELSMIVRLKMLQHFGIVVW